MERESGFDILPTWPHPGFQPPLSSMERGRGRGRARLLYVINNYADIKICDSISKFKKIY